MIGILNAPIITADGLFRCETISLESARELLNRHDFISAIGHASTADILTELLEIDIPVNRISFTQEVGQKAIIFKLKSRCPEGVILTKSEIEALGYEFKLITREEMYV
jgi:hypothetical protein